jgi:hypothetical protein
MIYSPLGKKIFFAMLFPPTFIFGHMNAGGRLNQDNLRVMAKSFVSGGYHFHFGHLTRRSDCFVTVH